MCLCGQVSYKAVHCYMLLLSAVPLDTASNGLTHTLPLADSKSTCTRGIRVKRAVNDRTHWLKRRTLEAVTATGRNRDAFVDRFMLHLHRSVQGREIKSHYIA